MRTMKVALAALVCGVTGCASSYPYGAVYDATTTPHGLMRVNADGANKPGSKQGEACATGVLWLFAWGDASLAAAKAAGSIKEVHSIEQKDFNVLGIYHQGCTEVHGE